MRILSFVVLSAITLGLVSCGSKNEGITSLASEKDSLSYSLGVMIGTDLKKQSMDTLADINIFIQAMRDVLSGAEAPLLTSEESEKNIQKFMEAASAKKYESTKADGEKYLEENGKRKEVITLSSGLQYEVIKEGTGAKPTLDKKVKAHYTGMFTDGKTFDSSRNGEPAEFPLANVIKGWQEGLALMSPGAHYKLYTPWFLAYGEQGIPNAIPPYSTLVFDVELISFE